MTAQLQLLLRQLTTSQRIGIAFGAIASALALVVFVTWAGRTDPQPAFTKLSTSDAAALSEALRTAKIPFQVADAGATILVPPAALADARVAAAAAGIATDGGSKGFELFDETGFGMSEFDQRVTYQRALEGKLASTIGSMDGIASATVSIVAAEDGLFSDQDRPASASVVVRMRNGQPPDAAMVRGIVSTVAGAVAGLAPESVTVVDESGRVLAGPTADAAGDGMATQLSVERGLSAKVQALVDRALGSGHASVAVSATLDLDKVEQTVTTVKPIDAANWTPTSVQTIEERYAGAAGDATGGIPGTGSNVPGLPTYPGTLPAASQAPAASGAPDPSPAGGTASASSPAATPAPTVGGYVRKEETVNYNSSQTIERIIRQPGAIERLSVAVLLDEAALGSVSADGLKTSIEAAIGADPARGDVVSVSAVPFAAAPAPEGGSPLGGDVVDTVGGLLGSLLGVLVAVVLLVLVWRNLRALRWRAEEMTLVHVEAARPELLEAYTPTGERARIAEMPAREASPQERIQEQLRAVANDKPEEIAGLVSSWLRSEGHR